MKSTRIPVSVKRAKLIGATKDVVSAILFVFSFSPLLLGLNACSKKAEVSYITVQLPKAMNLNEIARSSPGEARSISSPVSSYSDNGSDWNSDLNPTSGSQINCFAIFVGGPNLSNNYCDVDDNTVQRRIQFGPNRGFVPAGSAVLMEVPAGPDRVFHVVGLQSASLSACSSYMNKAPDAANLSEPFLIASQRANIPSGESSLAIVAALDPNKKIKDCSIQGTPGGGNSGGLQIDYGSSKDGKIEVTAASGPNGVTMNVNQNNLGLQSVTGYTHQPASNGSSSSKIASASRRVVSLDTSGSTAGKKLVFSDSFSNLEFAVSDEVLWYVAGGRAEPGPPDDPTNGACGGDLYLGRFGFAKIAAINSNDSITLDRSITATPSQVKIGNLTAASTSNNFCRIAIQRVLNFEEIKVSANSELNIKVQPYSHESGTGGVLPLRVRRMEVDGRLNLLVDAAGYRGSDNTNYSGGSLWGDRVQASSQPNGNGGGSRGADNMGSGGGGAGAGEGGTGMNQVQRPLGGQPFNHGAFFRFSDISINAYHACGLSEGKLQCWGENSHGQLGRSTTEVDAGFIRLTPQPVLGTATFKQVSVGTQTTCAINSNDRLQCWGSGERGALGTGDDEDRFNPDTTIGSAFYRKIVTSSSDGSHTCGILRDSKYVNCWGLNDKGQVGNDSQQETILSPAAIAAPAPGASPLKFDDLALSYTTTCGIAEDKKLYCWGDNDDRQFGVASPSYSLKPVLAAAGRTFKKVALGEEFGCGIDFADSKIYCWGDGDFGQIGNGQNANVTSPTLVSGNRTYIDLVAGSTHACAIDSNNVTYCWGDNSSGQLGDGTVESRNMPTAITGSFQFSKISAGFDSTCGVLSDGQALCWGDGTFGQLGSVSLGSTSVPQRVRQQLYQLPFFSQKFLLGGGGGAGLNGTNQLIGGSGGGMIFLIANEVRGSGRLDVSSSGGSGITNMAGDASGGGGAGVIAAAIRKLTVNTVNIISKGGTGGEGGEDNNGGGGGGGAIELYTCSAESTASPVFAVQGGPASDRASGERGLFLNSNSPALCNSP